MMNYSEFCAARGLKDHSDTKNELVLGGQEDLLCTCTTDTDDDPNCWCQYWNENTDAQGRPLGTAWEYLNLLAKEYALAARDALGIAVAFTILYAALWAAFGGTP